MVKVVAVVVELKWTVVSYFDWPTVIICYPKLGNGSLLIASSSSRPKSRLACEKNKKPRGFDRERLRLSHRQPVSPRYRDLWPPVTLSHEIPTSQRCTPKPSPQYHLFPSPLVYTNRAAVISANVNKLGSCAHSQLWPTLAG